MSGCSRQDETAFWYAFGSEGELIGFLAAAEIPGDVALFPGVAQGTMQQPPAEAENFILWVESAQVGVEDIAVKKPDAYRDYFALKAHSKKSKHIQGFELAGGVGKESRGMIRFDHAGFAALLPAGGMQPAELAEESDFGFTSNREFDLSGLLCALGIPSEIAP